MVWNARRRTSLTGRVTTSFDLVVLDFFTRSTITSPEWHAFVRDYLAGNDLVKGGPIVAALWWFWFRPHRDQAKRRELVIASSLGALVAAGVSRAFTLLVPFRARPFSTPGLNLETPLPQLWEIKGGSFPSDHMALAFAMVAGIFLVSPPLGLALAAYALLLVGLPRVYLGIHWPTDILGGAVVGILVTLVIAHPRIRAAISRLPMRWADRSPALFHAAMFLVAFGLMTRFEDFRAVAGLAVHAGSQAVHSAMSAVASTR
jgi:membrane-associated phospholipid phosphatase